MLRERSQLFIFLVVITMTLTLVKGHGWLHVPPGRSSVWRHPELQAPTSNTNDMSLNCGGLTVRF